MFILVQFIFLDFYTTDPDYILTQEIDDNLPFMYSSTTLMLVAFLARVNRNPGFES